MYTVKGLCIANCLLLILERSSFYDVFVPVLPGQNKYGADQFLL
jgi:hypothetical protein